MGRNVGVSTHIANIVARPVMSMAALSRTMFNDPDLKLARAETTVKAMRITRTKNSVRTKARWGGM